MSDDLRQYPATPRRLEKLRQQGIVPSQAAVAGVLGLAAATLVLAVAGGWIGQGLRGMLARDLQSGMARPEALAGLLMTRLGMAVAIIAGAGVVTAGAGVLARLLQGTLGQRSGRALYLPMSDTSRARGGRTSEGSLLLGLIGLGCAGVVYAAWLGRLPEAVAGSWRPGDWPPYALGWVWLRWLAVLGGLAILHAAGSWWRHLQQARMTHREMVQERREAEGSWLKRRGRDKRGS
jgi:flagellar biosynthesis protein FlhB